MPTAPGCLAPTPFSCFNRAQKTSAGGPELTVTVGVCHSGLLAPTCGADSIHAGGHGDGRGIYPSAQPACWRKGCIARRLLLLPASPWRVSTGAWNHSSGQP